MCVCVCKFINFSVIIMKFFYLSFIYIIVYIYIISRQRPKTVVVDYFLLNI